MDGRGRRCERAALVVSGDDVVDRGDLPVVRVALQVDVGEGVRVGAVTAVARRGQAEEAACQSESQICANTDNGEGGRTGELAVTDRRAQDERRRFGNAVVRVVESGLNYASDFVASTA